MIGWLRRLLRRERAGDPLRARNDELLKVLREHVQRLALLAGDHPERPPEPKDGKPVASDRRPSRRPI
jgi:hypothetical protein